MWKINKDIQNYFGVENTQEGINKEKELEDISDCNVERNFMV